MALFFLHDRDAWIQFCRHPDWDQVPRKRPKTKDQANPLPFVLRLAKGDTPSAKSSVYNWRKVLQPFWDSENSCCRCGSRTCQSGEPATTGAIGPNAIAERCDLHGAK